MKLVICLIMVISFFGCQTRGPVELVSEITLPLEAQVKPVHWIDDQERGGLFLAYDQYRMFKENIIEYRREIADLRALIDFYRGDGHE